MYNPIYFRTDKYDLIANGTKWFTTTPDVASKIDGADTYKALNYVVLEEKATGTRFIYVNLHLIVQSNNSYTDADGESYKIQQMQVAYLRAILEDIQNTYGELPMFIGGDFNNSFTNVSKWFNKTTVTYVEEAGLYDVNPDDAASITESVKVTAACDQAINAIYSTKSCMESGVFDAEYTKGNPIDLWYTSNFDGIVHCYHIIDNLNKATGKYPSDHLPAKLYVTLYTD